LIDAAIARDEGVTPTEPLSSLAVSVDWAFPGSGLIDLLPAGRLDSAYALRAAKFEWQRFWAGPAGRPFLEDVTTTLANEYDLVLVDTSSGVADSSAVEVFTVPDALCLCFTLNPQSVQGCQQLAASVTRERALDPMRIFPIATRVDPAEKILLDDERARARTALGSFLSHLGSAEDQQRYWRDTEAPYVPYFTYGEVLPVFVERTGEVNTVSATSERLCRYLTGDSSLTFTYPDAGKRQSVIAAYRSLAM